MTEGFRFVEDDRQKPWSTRLAEIPSASPAVMVEARRTCQVAVSGKTRAFGGS
jgi:hypothetical protein